jgi:hypothetical protein
MRDIALCGALRAAQAFSEERRMDTFARDRGGRLTFSALS